MKKNSNFFESFLCAFRGIIYIFKTERNFRFHIVFSLLVLLSSLTLNLSYVEYNFKVKIIKDMASGAVLVSAFISVIVGYLIFVPKILVIIGG